MKSGEAVRLLQRVIDLYGKTLRNSEPALENLKARKLYEPTLIEVFQMGFSNGSLEAIS